MCIHLQLGPSAARARRREKLGSLKAQGQSSSIQVNQHAGLHPWVAYHAPTHTLEMIYAAFGHRLNTHQQLFMYSLSATPWQRIADRPAQHNWRQSSINAP
jgi:hypothetical protein